MSKEGVLQVPDQPILPFIEGDGTGPDIWRASQRVFDAAVEKAYGGKKKIAWYEVYAGEKAFTTLGEWLPDGTVDATWNARARQLNERLAELRGHELVDLTEDGYALTERGRSLSVLLLELDVWARKHRFGDRD